MLPTELARVGHEINRAYRIAIGDPDNGSWEDLGEKKRVVVEGVVWRLAHPDAPESVAHERWMEGMAAAGWRYGAVEDKDEKLHPCMVPYHQLPLADRIKDALFVNLIRAYVNG